MTVWTADGSAQQRKQLRRRRRWTKRVAIAGVLAGLAAGAWAFDDDATPGLKGILPAEPPAELSASAFEPLGPTWQEWSNGTADAIAAFYRLEGDVAAQKQALAQVKNRLRVLDKAIADNKYSMILEPLVAIRGPLARRVALAEAVLTTLETDPATARAAAVDSAAQGVKNAVAKLEQELKAVPGGAAWLPFVGASALKSALAASSDNAATVAALKDSAAKLAKRETIEDAAQKAFLGRSEFVELHAAIDGHLAAIDLKSKPVDMAQLRGSLGELVAAVEEYEITSSAVSAGNVRTAADTLRTVAPDGGAAILAALQDHYFNYNVRIAASETFLNRLLSDSRVEQGQVNDFILGAAVGGWQTTSTNVQVDVQPSANQIAFDLVLSGTVQSSTAGRTSQATIYTSGYHTFESRKSVTYDGDRFTTNPANTFVNANNTTTGATTRVSGMPLFGRVAERIAMREAAERRPAAESIAAGRVSGRVTPRFDEEVDRAFAKASTQIENELAKGLKATGIYPDAQSYSSGSDEILVATRLMGSGKLGGYKAEPKLLETGTGAVMLLHESVVNNTIDQMGFNGKKMSEEELRHHLEDFLSKALSREFKFRSPEAAEPVGTAAAEASAAEAAPAEEADDDTKGPAQLVFAPNDPVRIQFRNGELLLVIRAGLEREGRDPIPLHEIMVPLTFSVNGSDLIVKRDALQIAPIEGRSNPIQQKVMNTRISAALPDRTVSGTFKLKGPNREVNAVVTAIDIIDGWISVRVR